MPDERQIPSFSVHPMTCILHTVETVSVVKALHGLSLRKVSRVCLIKGLPIQCLISRHGIVCDPTVSSKSGKNVGGLHCLLHYVHRRNMALNTTGRSI